MLTRKENYKLGDAAVRHLHDHIDKCLAGLERGGMAELSRQMGMNPTAIRDFLKSAKAGSHYPSIRLFLGIAHVVGYTVSELIGEPSAQLSPDDKLVLQTARELTTANLQVWVKQAAAFKLPPDAGAMPDGATHDGPTEQEGVILRRVR